MSDYRSPTGSARISAPGFENSPMPPQQGSPTGSDTPQSQALDWLLLLENADDDCRARFAEWLAISPANAEAFERAQRCWQSPTLVTAAARLERGRQKPPQRSRRIGRTLAIAASLLLVIGITLQSDLLLRLRADHVTAVGQRQSLDLADGSRVLLNTGSAFSSQIDERQRVTQLLRGEAYFDVAKDSNRPFLVNADLSASRYAVPRFPCVTSTMPPKSASNAARSRCMHKATTHASTWPAETASGSARTVSAIAPMAPRPTGLPGFTVV